MRKNEIKKAKNNDLIREYVFSYSRLSVNVNLGLGTKQLSNHCIDLEQELLNRGLLTNEDIERLNG